MSDPEMETLELDLPGSWAYTTPPPPLVRQPPGEPIPNPPTPRTSAPFQGILAGMEKLLQVSRGELVHHLGSYGQGGAAMLVNQIERVGSSNVLRYVLAVWRNDRLRLRFFVDRDEAMAAYVVAEEGIR
jgi:hypothetical protein